MQVKIDKGFQKLWKIIGSPYQLHTTYVLLIYTCQELGKGGSVQTLSHVMKPCLCAVPPFVFGPKRGQSSQSPTDLAGVSRQSPANFLEAWPLSFEDHPIP